MTHSGAHINHRCVAHVVTVVCTKTPREITHREHNFERSMYLRDKSMENAIDLHVLARGVDVWPYPEHFCCQNPYISLIIKLVFESGLGVTMQNMFVQDSMN